MPKLRGAVPDPGHVDLRHRVWAVFTLAFVDWAVVIRVVVRDFLFDCSPCWIWVDTRILRYLLGLRPYPPKRRVRQWDIKSLAQVSFTCLYGRLVRKLFGMNAGILNPERTQLFS